MNQNDRNSSQDRIELLAALVLMTFFTCILIASLGQTIQKIRRKCII